MILRIEDIKEVCSKLLMAVDSNNLSQITETLELEIVDKQLYMSVTNREYIVTIKIPTFRDEQFHATVNAIVFPPKKGGKSIPPEILKIILPELLRELLLQLLQPWEESARPDGLR